MDLVGLTVHTTAQSYLPLTCSSPPMSFSLTPPLPFCAVALPLLSSSSPSLLLSVRPDALSVSAELLRLFLRELLVRSAMSAEASGGGEEERGEGEQKGGQGESVTTVEVEQLERILTQCMLDFQ